MSDINNLLNDMVNSDSKQDSKQEPTEVEVENVTAETETEVIQNDTVKEDSKEEVEQESKDDSKEDSKEKSPLDLALAKIQNLEDQNAKLLEESTKWKSFSRKNETSLKELKREMELGTILKNYQLPEEAKDFLKGDSIDELNSSAEKLSIIFNSKQGNAKKTFTSQLQGIEGGAASASPLSQIFAGWE